MCSSARPHRSGTLFIMGPLRIHMITLKICPKFSPSEITIGMRLKEHFNVLITLPHITLFVFQTSHEIVNKRLFSSTMEKLKMHRLFASNITQRCWLSRTQRWPEWRRKFSTKPSVRGRRKGKNARCKVIYSGYDRNQNFDLKLYEKKNRIMIGLLLVSRKVS